MASKVKSILQLLRVRQYYKNIIMFLGVFFGGKLFSFDLYSDLLIGFILLCFISSINYIINDILDIEKDKQHPEKRLKRPLASGAMRKYEAYILLAILFAIEIYFILRYANMFSLILVVIFINGFLYNMALKNSAFADVITLALMYVWRAIAGCLIIGIMVSPWLFLTVYFTALFLALSKRKADLILLGSKEDAANHKRVYQHYDLENINQFLTMISTALLIVYCMYCIIGPTEPNSIIQPSSGGYLIYSIPFAIYLIMRFSYLTNHKPEVARNAEKMITDKGMIIGGGLFVLVIFIILYLQIGRLDFFIRI